MNDLRKLPWHRSLAALRRFNRHPKVRKGRYALLFILLYIAFSVWLQIKVDKHDGAYLGFWKTALSDLILVVPGGLLALWLRRRYKQQDEVFSASITPRVEVSPSEGNPRLRNYLVDRAAILSVLLSRAGSEAYLSAKELPEGMEVITRRTLLAFLREHNLWGKLEASEVELLSAPDGHWSQLAIRKGVMTYSEQLRLLRWTLQIDLFLAPISRSACPDYRQCRELIDRFSDVQNDTALLSSWDLRVARDESQKIASSSVTKVEPADQPAKWNQPTSEATSIDPAAAAPGIPKEGRVKISIDGARAFKRYEYANYLTDLLESGEPSSFPEWAAQLPSARADLET